MFFGLKQIIFALLFSCLLSACYYKPFVTYTLNKKGFKRFSKKEQIAGDNSNPHRNYDVNAYDWQLEVFPEKKKISGIMNISFTPKASQDTFLFDLQKQLKITSIRSLNKELIFTRTGDLLYLVFKEKLTENKKLKLEIVYEGKPVSVAGEGPIQWKKDEKGRHWISTITEGIGPHFMMPCSALLSKEADSSIISITVPQELTVVSNGGLTDVKGNKGNSTRTFTHLITNPINIYNLSFNIGHFQELSKPYTDINGVEREVLCYPLDYNQALADTFYDQVPIILKEFEKMFGLFPWWTDGCKFVESTFSAMEHQSAIAMGSDYGLDWKGYNFTLIHELAHEWWGNSVTGKDYCDAWLHEGMATYAEALFFEKIYGLESYEKRIAYGIKDVYNTIPIYKVCDVLYNSWTNGNDQDIYEKGALAIHSLRKTVNNDSLFFKSLLLLQKDFANSNVSTDEVIDKFNELLENDYSDLFNWYLKRTKPPVLITKIDKGEMSYKWKEEIPFYKEGSILLEVNNQLHELKPTTSFQKLDINGIGPLTFLQEKSIYYTVENSR